MERKWDGRRPVAAGILALGLLTASNPSSAADTSGRLGVGITILPICSIATHASPDGTGQASPGVTVRCAKGAAYELELMPPTLQAAPGEAAITWVTISF